MDLTPEGPKPSLAEQFDAIFKPAAPASGIPAPPPPGLEPSLLAAARAALGGTQLSAPARSLLLLRLCERASLLPQAEVDGYWEELTKTARKSFRATPSSLAEFNECRAAMFPTQAPEDEEEEEGPPKGFEAEIDAEIREALRLVGTDRAAAAAKLRACDERVEGRSWPFGKHRVERQIVWAWASVDREVALGRLEALKKANRWELLKALSIAEPLTPSQWNDVVRSIGMKDTRTSLLQLLADAPEDAIAGPLLEAGGLYLPADLLQEATKAIREDAEHTSRLVGTGAEADVRHLFPLLRQVWSVVHLVRDAGPAIPSFFGQMLLIFGTRDRSTNWPHAQLVALEGLVRLGVESKLLSDDNADASFRGLSDQRGALAWARYAAETASPDGVLRAIELVASRTGNNRSATALCLRRLIGRGLGRQTIEAADRAGLDDVLRTAVRRTWLADDPVVARRVMTPEQMRGDPVGEFLTQPDVREMATYLRTVTAGGSQSLPGPMWIVPGEERPSGLKGRRWDSKRASMSPADIVTGYVERTLLYEARTAKGKPDDELDEHVDFTQFGRYRCEQLDPSLLGALVAWGDDRSEEVASLAEILWERIRPDSELMFAGDLRAEILTRCATVLAADPDVLLDSCLSWLQREWVKKGRKHKLNGKDVEAHLPAEVLGGMCLIGAGAVRASSVARSDHLVVRGLERHLSAFEQVRTAGSIYGRGKPPLTFEPPVKLKPLERGAWEFGVIDAALPTQMPARIATGGGLGARDL
jgi:hypothetical protein